MKEILPKPTTFKELQERREILERSMELNTYNAKRSFNEAGNELPRFVLKKVAVPAALIAAAAIGVDKLMKNNNPEEQSYQTEQREEQKEGTSFLTKAWMFAMPIIQPYIRKFIRDQISSRFKNSSQ
ncbi:MAG: hypothetical protein AAGG68_22325 [Bacteroidota bacterium]